jgi:hypothetical protein
VTIKDKPPEHGYRAPVDMMSTLQNKGSERNVNDSPAHGYGATVAVPDLKDQGVTGPLKKKRKKDPLYLPMRETIFCKIRSRSTRTSWFQNSSTISLFHPGQFVVLRNV